MNVLDRSHLEKKNFRRKRIGTWPLMQFLHRWKSFQVIQDRWV